MVVGFTTTYAIGAYQHWCCEFRARCTPLCDKVCQWLSAGRWGSKGTQVFSTNKTDCHDITKILLNSFINVHVAVTVRHSNKSILSSMWITASCVRSAILFHKIKVIWAIIIFVVKSCHQSFKHNDQPIINWLYYLESVINISNKSWWSNDEMAMNVYTQTNKSC